MMRSVSRPRAAHGFTLVELLLATVLLVLLVAGAWSGIRTATRAAASGEDLIERTNRVRVAQEFLRRELTQSLALAYEEEAGTGQRLMFGGERDQLTFVAPMPGYLGRGGPYVQRLSFASGNGGRELVFHHVMLNGFDAREQSLERDSEPVVLLDRIRTARFQYRAIDERGQLGDWRDQWDKPGQLPLMVRVELEFERDANMIWPELVIPMMVDPSAATAASEPSFFSG
jgi:general secretion pathway protein J